MKRAAAGALGRRVLSSSAAASSSASASPSSSSSSSSSREQRIRARLQQRLQPTELLVEDLSGGCEGGTVNVRVASQQFAGKSLVQQHKLVNECIGDEMKTLHAVVIKTIVPNKQ